MKKLYWVSSISSLIFFSFGWYWWYYSLTNGSGHTSIPPFWGSAFFALPLIFGVIHIVVSRGKALSALILSVTGASGVAFGFFVHYASIMQEYNYWLHHGANIKNPHSTTLLFIYAFGVLLLIFLSFVFAAKKANRNEP